jgi:hypothetical protein
MRRLCVNEKEASCLLRVGMEYLPIVFIPGLSAVFRAGNPLTSLGFADSLSEQQDLVARYLDRNRDQKRSGLKL